MGREYGKGSHTIYDIQYHLVWVTKYRYYIRYYILTGEIALRARELLRQTCDTRSITILSGYLSQDHVRLHVSAPWELAPIKVVQYGKGQSPRLNRQGFPHLRRRYWGKHIWARGYFCATVGKVTEKMIAAYIEHQEKAKSKDVFQASEPYI